MDFIASMTNPSKLNVIASTNCLRRTVPLISITPICRLLHVVLHFYDLHCRFVGMKEYVSFSCILCAMLSLKAAMILQHRLLMLPGRNILFFSIFLTFFSWLSIFFKTCSIRQLCHYIVFHYRQSFKSIMCRSEHLLCVLCFVSHVN